MTTTRPGPRRVTGIGTTPVKATRLHSPPAVVVDHRGIVGDRRFMLVQDDGRQVSAPQKGAFLGLSFHWDPSADTLTARCPDGSVVSGPSAGTGDEVHIDHSGIRTIPTRVVDGPWSDLLSRHAGYSVRLVRVDDGHSGFDVFPITLVSTASLRRVGEAARGATLDPARVRASFVLDGDRPHQEEEWEGRTLVIGALRLRVRTPVPRCVVTSFEPSTGERDLNVPQALASYREPVRLPDGLVPRFQGPPLAVFAEVLTGGRVEVGMPFHVED